MPIFVLNIAEYQSIINFKIAPYHQILNLRSIKLKRFYFRKLLVYYSPWTLGIKLINVSNLSLIHKYIRQFSGNVFMNIYNFY